MPDFREADFPIFQFLVVVVHVFSAIIWIGGSIFLTLVMIPVARGMEPPAMGFLFLRKLLLDLAELSGCCWHCLLFRVPLRSMAEGFGRFGEDGFWSTEIGVVLLVKFVLVVLVASCRPVLRNLPYQGRCLF